MTYPQMIQQLKIILEEACASNSNAFGYEIWTYHMVPVIDFAKDLARVLGADEEIVEVAAILHDYASVKDYALYKDHHLHGAVEAEKLLKEFGYTQDKIDQVKVCIEEHRGIVVLGQSTKESACVASADAMAHIANVTSLLHLAYAKKGLGVREGATWVRNKITRSWKKLCPQAQDMVRDQYNLAMVMLSENPIDTQPIHHNYDIKKNSAHRQSS